MVGSGALKTNVGHSRKGGQNPGYSGGVLFTMGKTEASMALPRRHISVDGREAVACTADEMMSMTLSSSPSSRPEFYFDGNYYRYVDAVPEGKPVTRYDIALKKR